MSPMDVFVAEGNVEIYLSRLHATWRPEVRDALLRLVCDEEARMGHSREHLENGERRVIEGKERLRKQRELIVAQPCRQGAFVLETLEKTQLLLEQHLGELRKQHMRRKL